MQSVFCPKCTRDDLVIKVSEKDDPRLRFPEEPQWDDTSWKSCLENVLIMLTIAILVVGVILYINSGNVLICVGTQLSGILIPGLCAIYIASERNKKKKQWEAYILLSKKAFEKWEKLYYCGREDIVFDPSDGTSAPATEMLSYISI